MILALAAGFILRTILLFLRRKKSYREVILAIVVWFGVSIVGLFPNITNVIAEATGFQLGINAVLVFSVLILSFLTLRLILKNDKMENSITRLVRQESLKELREQIDKQNN
jgi:hypothetical protein